MLPMSTAILLIAQYSYICFKVLRIGLPQCYVVLCAVIHIRDRPQYKFLSQHIAFIAICTTEN